MLEVQSNIKKINEARHANGKEEKVNKDDDPQLMGEAKTAMNDMFDMNVNSLPTNDDYSRHYVTPPLPTNDDYSRHKYKTALRSADGTQGRFPK